MDLLEEATAMQTRRVMGTRLKKQAWERLAAFEQRIADRRRATAKRRRTATAS